ncbi:hypothetical protein [Luteipulveratus mongoliensis]|uniref:hypothetical protein n=1 Tax=Luteipulveratus mongoliensis TaxID=571913 RepID=UPI0012EEBF31|nr:hypothetical protein [Luteipulveratus mongoliensis]
MRTAAALLVLLALIGAWIVHVQVRDRLKAGESRTGEYSLSSDFRSSSTFELPDGGLSVTVEVGEEATKYDDWSDRTRVRAPRGGRLVEVSWSPQSRQSDRTIGVTQRPSSLSLRSGGRTILLEGSIEQSDDTSSGETSKERLVAVPGDLADLEIVAGFAGRQQSVRVLTGKRELGDFATLYRPRSDLALQPVDVGPDNDRYVRGNGFRWELRPVVGQTSRRPYVEGLGWAAAGREWFVVQGSGYYSLLGSAAEWSSETATADYNATRVTTTVTANGTRPSRTVTPSRNQQDPSTDRVISDLTFSVVSGAPVTLSTVVDAPLTRDDRHGAETEAPKTATLHRTSVLAYPGVVDPRKAS